MITSGELQSIDDTGNPFIDALTYGQGLVPGITISYVLEGERGDGPYGGATWSANGARAAFAQAAATWSAVANVSFAELAGPYNGTGATSQYDWIERFTALAGDTIRQYALPHSGTMEGEFNNLPGNFSAGNLKQGGIGFATVVHEIGHGLGLLHPHDDGVATPGDGAFPGVTGPFELGGYGLNQGIYSVMSYNSGFAEPGYTLSEDFGWEMGPMAFDIAAIQSIYGPNLETNRGNTSYLLPQSNAAGTGWLAIWDAGGDIDVISAGVATADAYIDLRAATLQFEPGGGGFVSRIAGVNITASSLPEARMLVSCFALSGLTVRSLSRAWIPTICPS